MLDITVGFCMPFSGRYSSVGESAKKGAILAEKEINESTDRIDFEVIYRDTGGTEDDVSAKIESLYETCDIDIVMGFASSSVAMAAAELLREQNIPMIVTAAQSPAIVEDYEHTYRVVSDLIQLNTVLARYVNVQTDGSSVAGILPDYRFGKETWRHFTEALGEETEIVDAEYVQVDDEKAYQRAIESVIQTNADVIYTSLWSKDLEAFIKRASEMTLFDEISDFVMGSAVISDVLRELGPEMVRGHANTHYYHTSPATERNANFVKRFVNMFNEFPSDVSQEAYKGMHCVEQAVTQSQDTTAVNFASELKGITFQTPEGSTRIRAKDRKAVEENLWIGEVGPLPGQDHFGFVDIMSMPSPDV